MVTTRETGVRLVIFSILISITITDAQKSLRCSRRPTRTCNQNQFPCLNGKCISRHYYCDSSNNCGDNSDEEYCGRSHVSCPINPSHIRCKNSAKCIPEVWICDGIKDCPEGDDENTERCEGTKIGAKNKALKWMYDRTLNDYTGLKSDALIHKAAVALFLAEPFSNISYFQLNISKDVSIQLLARLAQTKLSAIPSADLAASVNAMLVTCLNPRKFHGMDLVQELRKRVDSQNYTNPYILLTLCNAGDTITEKDITKLADTFTRNDREFWTDMKAMVILALSCAAKQPGNSVDVDMIKDFTAELKTHQYRNGSVENVQTTALVLQALYAAESEEDPDNFDEDKALLQLISSRNQDGSFGNFMKTYYVLPVFNCMSLVNITTDHCEPTETDENSALQNLANRAGPKIRVQYSLWFGDRKDMERTMALMVPVNMSFYGIMEIAAEIDERYRFEYLVKARKPYVNGISGLVDDPETGKFWFLYSLVDGEPSPIPKSPADVIPKDNDHFVMWYQSGSWID